MKKRIEKIKSNLKQRNLKYPEDMELFDDKIRLRDVKIIAQRAIVTAIMAKCAFDLYDAESPDNIKKDCLARLNRFGVENCLFNAERQVLNDSYNESFDEIGWTYEAANALLWALGLLDNVESADCPEDVELELNKVFDLINSYDSFNDFISACNLRTETDLQDAFQLYWYYHWNIRDGQIFGSIPDSISLDVVIERRRALEWLLYSAEGENGDWDFGMHT